MKEDNESEVLVLDGTMGLKERSIVTIITKDPIEGEKEETFLFPHALIKSDALATLTNMLVILGYKIVRQVNP